MKCFGGERIYFFSADDEACIHHAIKQPLHSQLHAGAIEPQVWREAERIAALHHPAWGRLSPFVKALHTRNVFQILGQDLSSHSRFVICWTADGDASGGTGQALRIAHSENVPVLSLQRTNHLAHVRDQLALA